MELKPCPARWLSASPETDAWPAACADLLGDDVVGVKTRDGAQSRPSARGPL